MIRHTQITQNFVYPQIESIKPAYKFGSNTQVDAPILRSNGDWRDYVPLGELQNRNGVESYSCYIQACQHAVATLLEEEFSIEDSDFSERFNALLSGGSMQGGDPIRGVQTFRDYGLIPDMLLPFSPMVTTWSDFHSFKYGLEDECYKVGKDFLKKWDVGYDIVFERNDSMDEKYDKLREALKYSPVPMSVSAWYERDGIYVKPQGSQDNHLVLCVYLDDQSRPYFFDTYEPWIKVGEPFYNSDFAMRLTVNHTIKEFVNKPNWFSAIIEWIKGLFHAK